MEILIYERIITTGIDEKEHIQVNSNIVCEMHFTPQELSQIRLMCT